MRVAIALLLGAVAAQMPAYPNQYAPAHHAQWTEETEETTDQEQYKNDSPPGYEVDVRMRRHHHHHHGQRPAMTQADIFANKIVSADDFDQPKGPTPVPIAQKMEKIHKRENLKEKAARLQRRSFQEPQPQPPQEQN